MSIHAIPMLLEDDVKYVMHHDVSMAIHYILRQPNL